jgi:hypothetical protein
MNNQDSSLPQEFEGAATEPDLQDKCGEVQIKLGINDKEWEQIVGNKDGLYGFVKSLFDSTRSQEVREAYKAGYESGYDACVVDVEVQEGGEL